MSKTRLYSAIALGIIAGCSMVWWRAQQPLNSRVWAEDHAQTASAEWQGDTVTISGIRDFTYQSLDEHDDSFVAKRYDLNDIQALWYAVVPFGGVKGVAHTMLSFEFNNGSSLIVSVEARREQGEGYTIQGGLVRQFELMYVLGTEWDLLRRRTVFQEDDVYLYPTVATPEQSKVILTSILRRVEQLNEQPEWYNSLTNSCTSNILSHINELREGPIPWYSYKVLLPEHSDELAHKHNLLRISGDIVDIREQFNISSEILNCSSKEQFSSCIRKRVSKM